MIRNIRNSIAVKMFKDKAFLKAISFVLWYHQIADSNICKEYSVSKLSSLTGVHASTIKKRLQTLKNRNLVKIEGRTLIFLSITSKHRNRNQKLTSASFNSLNEVEKSLFAILICIIQQRKDFIHRAILDAKHSKCSKVIKKAKAIIRKYANGDKFRELGMSYKTIAKKLGISLKTAFEYVKYAVEHDFIIKKNHFLRVLYKGVNYSYVKGATFTTKDYAFFVYANTYRVSGYSMPIYKLINKKNKSSVALALK